ncbi:putidacin L1 family lectin-like bacteriocin [Pseudomonas chlororaphis]|uniref:putidacin L1 family lectin-like bacteriocin n=1 Tax=Pseudomonas chlororaphis TaxID=587753 RepID=UPI002368EC6A|nr:putidacin L1 family lectin-like bacteriocin [Pseudomonas chlororaphis]WDH36575.1 putidacin L1 family lectin-like bacteriocin [Pseudomonas chlororaphis]WDH42660.1 putidacin L1 family lectin-like bacteriocin [Pseudomonas chlororaphis]
MATWVRYNFNDNGSPVLRARYEMLPNQYLQSPNKRFKLIFQDDGNLALYDGDANVWVANSSNPYTNSLVGANSNHTYLAMNYGLVLYDLINNRAWFTNPSDPIDSHEAASLRAYTQLQDDGNIVTIDPITLWNGTPSIPVEIGGNAVVFAGPTELTMGVPYFCGDGALIFQGDGNVVNYGPNWSVRWASYTQNKGAVKAVFQADGNFVVYAANDVPLWNSGTGGNPDASLRLQPNGSLTVATDRPVWARFGYTPKIKPIRVLVEYGPYTVFKYDW